MFAVLCTLKSDAYGQNHSDYEKSLVSFDDYEGLMKKAKKIRKKRLISYDKLRAFQSDPHTVLLDTRSKDKYEARHLAGAINLPFTEFTTANLRKLIPDPETRIVIYCNNNFKGDPIFFTSKVYVRDNITLALNIPTYIGLYGYGYRNIYELNELVHIYDVRIDLEGYAAVTPRDILIKQNQNKE